MSKKPQAGGHGAPGTETARTGPPEPGPEAAEGAAPSDTGSDQTAPTTPTAGLIDALARRASSIVEQAASILEEEVAAGIVAARQAESKYLQETRLRPGETSQLLQRFRKDAHEVVDLLIDLLGVSADMLGNLARSAVTLGGGMPEAGNAQADPRAGTIPMVTLPRVLRPGEIGDLTLTIDNDQNRPTAPCAFLATTLINATGSRIPADHLSFDPPELVIGPQSIGSVTVTVRVPEDVSPGEYAGLIQSPAWPRARAVLTVHVGPVRVA